MLSLERLHLLRVLSSAVISLQGHVAHSCLGCLLLCFPSRPSPQLPATPDLPPIAMLPGAFHPAQQARDPGRSWFPHWLRGHCHHGQARTQAQRQGSQPRARLLRYITPDSPGHVRRLPHHLPAQRPHLHRVTTDPPTRFAAHMRLS